MNEFFSKLYLKLHNTSGESITETLVSLLIVVLSLTMMAGSIVSAAKINNKTAAMKTEFKAAESTPSGSINITIGSKTEKISVKKFTSANSQYVYYFESDTVKSASDTISGEGTKYTYYYPDYPKQTEAETESESESESESNEG